MCGPVHRREECHAQRRTGRPGFLRRRQHDGTPRCCASYFADDIVYHNIPMDPAEGIEATMAVIDMFVGMCEAMEFEIHHLASDGSTVLTERTDTFTIKGRRPPCPSWVPSTSRTGRSPHGGTTSTWRK